MTRLAHAREILTAAAFLGFVIVAVACLVALAPFSAGARAALCRLSRYEPDAFSDPWRGL